MPVTRASRGSASGGPRAAIRVTDPEVVETPGARAVPPGPGEIRFENVAFGYQGGRPIFTDLDLLIRGGEAVGVVGTTRAGKTTGAPPAPRLFCAAGGRGLLRGLGVRDAQNPHPRRRH